MQHKRRCRSSFFTHFNVPQIVQFLWLSLSSVALLLPPLLQLYNLLLSHQHPPYLFLLPSCFFCPEIVVVFCSSIHWLTMLSLLHKAESHKTFYPAAFLSAIWTKGVQHCRKFHNNNSSLRLIFIWQLQTLSNLLPVFLFRHLGEHCWKNIAIFLQSMYIPCKWRSKKEWLLEGFGMNSTSCALAISWETS